MNTYPDFQQAQPEPQRLTAVRAQIARHPIPAASAFFAAELLTGILAGVAAKAWLPQADPAFVAMCVLAVLIAGILTALRWWGEVGFNRPGNWRALRLLWLPAIVTIVLPFLGGVTWLDRQTAVYLFIGYLITGFMEEAWVRGLLLRVLQPIGPVRAVLLSALFFALLHVNNFLFRNPAIVLAQMVGAFCFGLAYGALRLRTNTIWFLILLHMLHDLLLRYSAFPLIPLNVVQDVILFFYSLYLLRGLRRQPSPETAVQSALS